MNSLCRYLYLYYTVIGKCFDQKSYNNVFGWGILLYLKLWQLVLLYVNYTRCVGDRLWARRYRTGQAHESHVHLHLFLIHANFKELWNSHEWPCNNHLRQQSSFLCTARQIPKRQANVWNHDAFRLASWFRTDRRTEKPYSWFSYGE